MNILDKIVTVKRSEIEQAKAALPLAELQSRVKDCSPVRNFRSAIDGRDTIRLIAEVKKASPSKGLIRPDFHPVAIAQAYEKAGAAAISVLTDVQHFQGSLQYLTDIRNSVGLPLLRKDFILDPYQVYEARVAGADAILLIAECLGSSDMQALHDIARTLGMHVLFEFYDERNVEPVIATGCEIIGVNNRDLRTFEVDFDHSIRMRQQIPNDITFVSESGIHSAADAQKLFAGGANAMLVGESLMRQADVVQATRRLLEWDGEK